jgi:hypothetical protein
MKLLRSLLGRAFLLALLAAVGSAVFIFVRHRPCATITSPGEVLHLSADGTRLLMLPAAGTQPPRGPLCVWDTNSGQLLHELLVNADDLGGLVLSPDERHAAAPLRAGELRLVDWRSGNEHQVDGAPPFGELEFSPKGNWLLLRPANEVRVIDVRDGRTVLRSDQHFVCFSGDDRIALDNLGESRRLAVWDLHTGVQVGSLPLKLGPLATSADGGVLAAERDFGCGVDVWDLRTFQHRFLHKTPHGHQPNVVFSADGRRLALLPVDEQGHGIEFLDTTTGQALSVSKIEPGDFPSGEFSADGLLWLQWRRAPRDPHLAVLEVASGRTLWERSKDDVAGFTCPPFLGGTDKAPTILDPRTGEPRARLPADFDTSGYTPLLTRDRRHFVISGGQVRRREPYFWETWLEKKWPDRFGDYRPGVLVVASDTGRELWRALNWGDEAWLSDNARTLVAWVSGLAADYVYRATIMPGLVASTEYGTISSSVKGARSSTSNEREEGCRSEP